MDRLFSIFIYKSFTFALTLWPGFVTLTKTDKKTKEGNNETSAYRKTAKTV
jgi:hypothetical protein